MTTFLQLQDEVLFNAFGERYRDYVKNYINEGRRAIYRRLGGGVELTVVALYTPDAALTSSAIPSGYVLERVDGVWLSTSTDTTLIAELAAATADTRLLPMHDWTDPSAASADFHSGEPVAYALRSQPATAQLYLFPIADASDTHYIVIQGKWIPGDLSADGDTFTDDVSFRPAIVAYARACAFRSEDDFDAADRWMLEYERALAALIFHQEREEGPVTVRGTWADEA